MVKSFELWNVPFFEGLSKQDVELLTQKFSPAFFPCETVIFSQGDHADRLYILLSGHVSIRFKPHDGEVIPVTEISSGDVFGWSAALGRDVYTSCAVTTSDSETLSIRGKDLRDLCTTHPETGVLILERLAEVIAERLKSTHQKVVELLWQGVSSYQSK
jgi:CRP/FNR family cyclic AMP-dependent transcriptional regulator